MTPVQMQSQEFVELKEAIEGLDKKIGIIMSSLMACQTRCVVDNTPGKWRGLGRALKALVKVG